MKLAEHFSRKPGGSRRARRLVPSVLVLLAVAAVAAQQVSDRGAGAAPASRSTSRRPFAANSPWNRPIPARPALDPNSTAMVRHLSGGRPHTAFANLRDYGVPIYEADASTPRHRVRCTEEWGACPLEQQPVPIPPAARPNAGSDHAMVVVDWSQAKSFEFWRAKRVNGGWQAAWGGVVDLNGDGRSGPTGSGTSGLAGVVRISEIARGRIDHALVFATDNACRRVYRYPATKTDGVSKRADCIPQGARVQLDPAIDVDAIPGITPAERAVAKALQVYGAYNHDNGGARMAFTFENPVGKADVYLAKGLPWDYYHMPHIPWQRLRVLRTWNGK